jgi:hypothetical protein
LPDVPQLCEKLAAVPPAAIQPTLAGTLAGFSQHQLIEIEEVFDDLMSISS